MKIFNRFLSLILPFGLIPIIPVFIFLFYYQVTGKQNILKYHRDIADISSRMAEENLYQFLMRLSSINLIRNNFSSEEIVKIILKENKEIVFVSLLNKNGKQENFSALDNFNKFSDYIDISKEEYFNKANLGQGIIGEFKTINSLPVATIIYPLKTNEFIYVLVNLNEMFYNLETQEIGKTGDIYFVNSDGLFFSFNKYKPSLNTYLLREKLIKNKGYFENLSDNNNNYIGAFARIGDLNLYILTLQNKNEAFREINLITSTLLFFILSLLTVFYFISMISAINISKPINKLIESAEKISLGNFDITLKEDPKIKEINNLILTFNQMANKLNKYKDLQVEKLLDEKNKLELLMSSISDAILLIDLSGKPIYLNNKASEIIKYSNLSTEQSIKEISEIYYESKTKPYQFPWDKENFYDIFIKEIKPIHEKPLSLIILSDITAQTKIDNMKEDFFHSIAHDIRAPLLNMQGYIKLLSFEQENNKKKEEYLKGVEEESSRIFKLVESILEISKLENGIVNFNPKEVLLKDFLNDFPNRFLSQSQDKNIEIKINVDENLKAKIDKNIFERVIDNLLSNAYKFSPKNSIIYINAEKDKDGKIIISVKDQGIGISHDKIDKIFEKFKGYDYRGFGLGLSIVKASVELHNGIVWVESKEGIGTTFYIKI